MDESIQRALKEDRTIDIITTGVKTGLARTTEIWFTNINGRIIICGTPGTRQGKRDWLANLKANPQFTFRFKESINAELPARAVEITDVDDRRAIMSAPETQSGSGQLR